MSHLIEFIIFYAIISTLYFLFKLWRIKKRIPVDFKYKQIIAGSLTELKHSSDNLELISKPKIDQQALGQKINHGYAIDNYQTYFYPQNLIILRQPTFFDLLKYIIEIPIKKNYIVVPHQNVVSWYVNEQTQHLGIKIFIPGIKKDLLIFVFTKLNQEIENFLQQQIPKLYSSVPFKEVNQI